MFEYLQMAPPDAILGLTEAFKRDSTPGKINLGVGVYKDHTGNVPVLESVKVAESRILAAAYTKNYLPILGAAEYGEATRDLLFGSRSEIKAARRAATAHTPGGTGALRVAADFIRRCFGPRTFWVSDPTWANHAPIFDAADHPVKTYPYYDPQTQDLDCAGMLAALGQASPGDVVLLHACCHNPSGVDLRTEQWRSVAEVLRERHLLPLVDFAYQGFGEGLEEDAAGLRLLCEAVPELLICSSYSKNFGLYQDRVGALTIVCADATTTARAISHIEKAVRVNFSNPPAHGGVIVTTILGDPDLRAHWEMEVAEMRDRINGMRRLFVETLKAKGISRDFSFIARQHGMFSFAGLTREQVALLKEKHAVYIVGSGRISVAGMTEANMDRVCSAIAAVL